MFTLLGYYLKEKKKKSLPTPKVARKFSEYFHE